MSIHTNNIWHLLYFVLVTDVHGQQKEASSFHRYWKLLVLVIPATASQGAYCGGAATLVVRDLFGAL